MTKNITLEILPNGLIRFKRGDKAHNDCMKEILANIVDDYDAIKEFDSFFSGSVDIELISGDTIFCG